MRKAYGPAVVAELDGLRLGIEKVTDEELSGLLRRYKALA
jgi:hypothetical protein